MDTFNLKMRVSGRARRVRRTWAVVLVLLQWLQEYSRRSPPSKKNTSLNGLQEVIIDAITKGTTVLDIDIDVFTQMSLSESLTARITAESLRDFAYIPNDHESVHTCINGIKNLRALV